MCKQKTSVTWQARKLDCTMAVPGVASLEWTSFVRGHHIYCHTWTPAIGEFLFLRREPDNEVNNYAVAVIKDGEVVGHIPDAITRVMSQFLLREGHSGSCEITGNRVNRGVQIGVEVPCVYKLYGRQAYIKRLEELLSEL